MGDITLQTHLPVAFKSWYEFYNYCRKNNVIGKKYLCISNGEEKDNLYWEIEQIRLNAIKERTIDPRDYGDE